MITSPLPDVHADAVALTVFRALPDGETGRQYTIAEADSGRDAIVRSIRSAAAVGFIAAAGTTGAYAVLDVLNHDEDIVQDFAIPTRAAFEWWARKLHLSVEPPAPWFGRMLMWRRAQPSGWAVEVDGRVHRLVRVHGSNSMDAFQVSHPGWYFMDHPDKPEPHPADPIGPFVAEVLSEAKERAEAWLLVGEADRRLAEDSPDFLWVFEGNGAVIGDAFNASPNPDQGRVDVHKVDVQRGSRGVLVGSITPRFEAVTGMVLTWTPHRFGRPVMEPCTSWHAAVRALVRELDDRAPHTNLGAMDDEEWP
ncbi:hypothetical protein [Saccharothrix hoggarensis]|uniref:Uncharacterized protein n=1 Tax=Saccharothrix hoggarensis TaxID=913853 RepID=A0ABW3QME9_9PSEU